MNSYRVFHRTKNMFVEFDRASAEFQHVANVQAGSLEEVYMLTNTIHDLWWKNENVDAIMTSTRSTSVGDEIEDADGVRWVVAPCGFNRVLS